MLEQYEPKSARLFFCQVIGKDAAGRKITRSWEGYDTPAGRIELEAWVKEGTAAAVADGLGDLLDQIKEYSRKHCAWLHSEKDVEEHALRCLILKAYEHWADFNQQLSLF